VSECWQHITDNRLAVMALDILTALSRLSVTCGTHHIQRMWTDDKWEMLQDGKVIEDEGLS